METINRDAELFKVLKQGLLDYRYSKADDMSNNDDEAQEEYTKQSNLNSDVGGGSDFDELSDSVSNRLLDEASEEIIQELQDVLPDNNVCLNVMIKILRGLV